MKICIIGSGYVGLVSGACFSELGNQVVCVDNNKQKIENLKKGIIPIYEPGLEELLLRNYKNKRLNFSAEINSSIKKSDIIFICVGTPTNKNSNNANLKYVFKVVSSIKNNLNKYKIIVTKSTVPVMTGDKIEKVLNLNKNKIRFDVISNPEFLREGEAIRDFMYPDRVVVGTNSKKANNVMRSLYLPLIKKSNRYFQTSRRAAELIKYAANAFLATKISFINEISNLCEKSNIDVKDVSSGIGLDERIGERFLRAGPGYGGSCFPKDTQALVKTANYYNSNISIVENVINYNSQRKIDMAEKIISALGENYKNKKISILGLAFKPETDDMRESPCLDIIPQLQEKNLQISAYDPVAMDEAKKLLQNIQFAESIEDCINNSDALVILTEWNEFRSLSPERLKQYMKGNILIDLRNALNPDSFFESGFNLIQVGRPTPSQ